MNIVPSLILAVPEPFLLPFPARYCPPHISTFTITKGWSRKSSEREQALVFRCFPVSRGASAQASQGLRGELWADVVALAEGGSPS